MLVPMLPHHPSWIQPVQFHLVCLLLSLESRVHYWTYLCAVYLIIITGPANCANNFWNNIFSTYSCHSIINDGSVFSVKCLPLSICDNLQSYQLWMIIHQSQIQIFMRIPLLEILCGISYTLKLCRKQRVYFGVAFVRLISCLLTGITSIWILPPGSESLSCKVSCWHTYPIEIDFKYPGKPM